MTLCACGCGQPTKPYTTTDKRIGAIKGEFAKWIKGHCRYRELAPLSAIKICRACKMEFPRTLEFFYPHMGRHRDKLAGRCKGCVNLANKKYYNSHMLEQKEYMRLYRLNNADTIKPRIKAWLDAHPGYGARAGKEWREAHDAKYRETKRIYREQNAETCKAAVRLYKSKRRANSSETIKAAQLLARLTQYNGLCGICDEPLERENLNWDHIEPISTGGKHALDNLQPAHKKCNSMKGARSNEWARERAKELKNHLLT